MSERNGDHSVHRSVSSEHRSLDAILEEARSVLQDDASGAAAQEVSARLREAVESHLIREESLYYPTIWSLRPDHKPPLVAFVESHGEFRSQLDAITEALDAEDRRDARQRIEQFADTFSKHEGAEERFLDSLERELDVAV